MRERTMEQYAQAVSDAESLLNDSLTVSRMISVRGIGLQLVRLADELIRDELNNSWDVDVELTSQVLALSSCAHATRNPIDLERLVHDLNQITFPIIETLAWQERVDVG